MKFTLYTADCTGNAKNTNYPHQKVITSEADLKKAVAFDHVCALYDNFSRQRPARMQHFTKQSKPVSTRNFPSLTAMRWMPPVFCLARKVRWFGTKGV